MNSESSNAPTESVRLTTIQRLRAWLFASPGPSTYFLSRWLFLRLLGLAYLIAFVSLWVQVLGLVGQNGILPIAEYIPALQKRFGTEANWRFPTLCWLDSGDGFLQLQCGAGALFSLLLIVGVAPVPTLVVLWALYLSLSTAGQDFLWFQWDILLLETGFLAIFCAPLRLFPRLQREKPPSRIVLWLLRWLLFRLMFLSGMVKLASQDEVWWNLTALAVHYETQPLPVWTSWYAHQLPLWLQQFCCGVMFVIELVLPFLIFGPRRLRHVAGFGIVLLMVLISATGNYNFFNLLAVALCMLLYDDRFLNRLVPQRFRRPFSPQRSPWRANPLRTTALGVLALFVVSLSTLQGANRIWRRWEVPEWVQHVRSWVRPFRSINSYGLFANMTESRPEVVVEGSNDGKTWLPYEFRWKPGDLSRAPPFIQPHQPRLDWQMWFAALRGNCQNVRWFRRFVVCLLEGSPEVLALLRTNPFPEEPPRYIRAVLYDYRFTDWATRSDEGTWWRRELLGLYCRPAALRRTHERTPTTPPKTRKDS